MDVWYADWLRLGDKLPLFTAVFVEKMNKCICTRQVIPLGDYCLWESLSTVNLNACFSTVVCAFR